MFPNILGNALVRLMRTPLELRVRVERVDAKRTPHDLTVER